MIYPTYWNPSRVREVFTTESRQKQRGLFLQTHRPFRRIRVDFCKDGAIGAGSFVEEETLRALVAGGQPDEHNRLFFVVGEPGSGKSELCQWLEYTIDPARHLAVHIPRSQTSAAHVAKLVRARLGGRGKLTHAPIQRQVEHVTLGAILYLYERPTALPGDTGQWEQLLTGPTLRSGLTQTLAHSLSLPEGLPDRLLHQSGADVGLVISRTTAIALRALLQQFMDQSVWLGDLQETLGNLMHQALQGGQRPLLLIEDMTAFQAVGDLLLDYLLDLSSGHWDAVIGVTTGYERTQLARATLADDMTHVHHRLRARFTLTDEAGRAYGLDEGLEGMAHAYLAAVREAEPRDAPSLHPTFKGLYPFTPTALQRGYEALEEEGNPRQTPRLFLEQLLVATLLASDPPPLTLDRSPYLRQPPLLFHTDQVPGEVLQALLRWYGEVGDRTIVLPRAVADVWGIPVPEALVQGEEIIVSRSYVASLPGAATLDTKWVEELRELQAWLGDGRPYPLRETLKRGIERLLLQLGDPRSLGSRDALALDGAYITYARGDERIPIFLGGNSGDVGGNDRYIKLNVMPDPEVRTVIEEIAFMALTGAELAQGAHNPALTLAWAEARWREYQGEIRSLLTRHLGGLDLDALIVMAWRLLTAQIGAPWGACPPLPHASDSAPYPERAPWSATRHGACYRAGEALLERHDTFRRLFIGTFSLRDTLLDYRRFERVAPLLASNDWLETLASLDLASIRTLPYKVRPTGESLYQLIVPLQRYAQALLTLDVAGELALDLAEIVRRRLHLQDQSAADLPALRAHIGSLPLRCGQLGLPWQAAWDEALAPFSDLSPEVLERLDRDLAALQVAGEALQLEPDLWGYQRFRHRYRPLLAHPYWKGVATVREILRQLRREGTRHYQRGGKQLTGTARYHELLNTIREIRQEVHGG